MSVDPAPPRLKPAETQWDALLAKYIRVWIWSALLGVNAGLSYSYLGMQSEKLWGSAGSILLVVMAVGVIATFASWWSLLSHLRVAILPAFFGGADTYEADEDAARERHAARTLVRAYQTFIIAATARLLFAVIDFAFQTFR